MTDMNLPIFAGGIRRKPLSFRLSLAAAVALWLATAGLFAPLAHADGGTNVQVSISISNRAGGRHLALSWTGPTGAVYVIERRAALGGGEGWQGIDATTQEQPVNQWTAPLDTLGESTGFFRLVPPRPAIFSVEPAVFVFGGPVDLYVVGQCFGTNTELRVGPLTLTNRIIVNPNLMQVTFVPPSAGTYVFDLVADNTILSSFAVQCYEPAAPPASVVQGPPDEPIASPTSDDPTTRTIAPAPLKVKEKGNRTKTTRSGDLDPPPSGALKVKEKGNRTKCTSNLRVTPSGELECDEVDLFVPGVGLDFIWGRRYRSLSGPNTAQGNRWDFSYNVSVSQVAGGIEVRDGMGRVDLLRSDNGFGPVYGADGIFYIGQFSNSLFRLTFPDTGYWEFEHPGGAVGKLLRIVDRNNNTMRLEYDGMGRLVRVIDTLNRTNTIAYSPVNGKIASLTDFSGRRVTYAYYRLGDPGGNDGDLRSVTSPPVTGTPNGNDFPLGKTTTYTYSRGFADPRQNSLLLTITDPKGQTPFRHVYQHNQSDLSFLRCIGRQAGTTNDRITYAYLPQPPSPANRYATMKIIVNDCVGNVNERLYDARLRELQTREFTGRAIRGLHVSDTTNRPTGKLRVDDPDYFETRYEWNADSLCTRVTHPRGNSTEMVYQRAFNQNSSRSNHARRHDADLRVLRERACCGGADTDGDGQTDTDELVTHFEHDSRFGSFPRGPRQSTSLDGSRMNSGQPTIIDNKKGLLVDFAILAVHPRGTATSASYDENGNCTVVNPRAARDNHLQGAVDVLEALRFAYNGNGQLTGITNAADGNGVRRVDTFEYYGTGPQLGYLRTATVDAQGPVPFRTTCEYDPRGNITRCIDPRGFDTLWTYNALDQATSKQTPNTSFGTLVRTTTLFSYDANDNLVQVDMENRDHNDVLDTANPMWSSGAEFDLLDRLTARWNEIRHISQGSLSAGTNRFFYDGNGNLVVEQSPEAVKGNDPNSVLSCQYDERDLPFREVRAPGTGLGATNVVDYDANGNCRRVNKVDAFSVKTKIIEHNGFDQCFRTTDALGNVATFAYDRNGNLVHERLDGELTDVPGGAGNRRLSETRYEYDSLDRLTRFRPAFFDVFTELAIGDGEATTSFTYAPNGQLLSETDDNGHTTRFTYDTAWRLSSVIDPKTNLVLYAYDACANPTNTTSVERSDLGGPEQRFSLSSEYDGRGRLMRCADNVGNTDQYFYDSRNNLVRHIDPRGSLSGFMFDGLCRQTLAIADLDGDGLLDYAADIGAACAYDDNSRLVSRTDDNGNVTRYAYDALDRPVATTNADNTVVRLVWSPRSNLILYGDANGTVISNSYDLLDRCVGTDIAPGPGVAATTTLETFDYDGASRLVRAATSPGGVEHTFAWNSLSDLSQQSSGGLILRATHDGVGNRLSVTYPSGRVVQHSYDSLHQPTALSTMGAGGLTQLATYAYEGPGRLGRIARLNGINTRINWNGLANPANQPGDFGWQQVARVNHARAMGGGAVDQRIAAYDRAQNKILRAQTAEFSSGGEMQTNLFAYDSAHRLTRGTKSRTFGNGHDSEYRLDGNGNRQVVLVDTVLQSYAMDNTFPEPADFQVNQYSLTPFGGQRYDRNGNLTSVGGPAGATHYQYDYADRLVRVDRDVGPTMVQIAAYAYDALGRRVSKTVFPPAAPARVTTSWFLDADCDGDSIVEEREDGVLRKVYAPRTRVDSWASIFERTGGVMFDGAGQTVYFHEDDLGNVLALTDANGGVMERCEYDDYGQAYFLDAKGDPLPVTSSPHGNSFLFHGMEWDSETGFYHARGVGENPLYEDRGTKGNNPLYDPKSGRYLSHHDSGKNENWNFLGGGSLSFAGDNPWSGGGGGGGMRAGISTSHSNIRTRGSFHAGGGGGGSGSGMRAGISTSRSNLRTKSRFASDEGGGGAGGMRAGISTSRSNLRTKGGFAAGGGGGGAGGDTFEVMFNPREYTISKSTVWRSKEDVYVWKIKSRSAVEDFEKNTENVSGGFGLKSVSEPLVHTYRSRACMDPYYDSYKFSPLSRGHRDVGGYRSYNPGQAHWGSARLINPVAMDKGLRFAARARHDIAMNAIRNMK